MLVLRSRVAFLLLAVMMVLPLFFVAGTTMAQGFGGPPDIQGGLCGGADLIWGGGNDCSSATGEAPDTINSAVSLVINIFSWIVGVVSVIMIIYGGFRYITSGGASDSVSSAKNTILYAIVGLVIVALAQVIVKFVLGTVAQTTS